MKITHKNHRNIRDIELVDYLTLDEVKQIHKIGTIYKIKNIYVEDKIYDHMFFGLITKVPVLCISDLTLKLRVEDRYEYLKRFIKVLVQE